jgi:hypothetical protein
VTWQICQICLIAISNLPSVCVHFGSAESLVTHNPGENDGRQLQPQCHACVNSGLDRVAIGGKANVPTKTLHHQ